MSHPRAGFLYACGCHRRMVRCPYSLQVLQGRIPVTGHRHQDHARKGRQRTGSDLSRIFIRVWLSSPNGTMPLQPPSLTRKDTGHRTPPSRPCSKRPAKNWIRSEQDFYTRVVVIAEWYDALTASKSYKEGYRSPDTAIKTMLEKAGKELDPI